MLVYTANSQILISLLLGDKLNTGKIEFGLDGGWNLSQISGIENSKPSNHWHIGFYFDFKIFKNPKLMFHSGVIVKSTMGCKNIDVYSLNDPILDSAFVGGTVERKLNYFYVPFMLKYMVSPHVYVEGGIMAALGFKACDIFTNKIIDKDDLQYKLITSDHYHPIEAGGIIGAGYRFFNGNGMYLGARYYYGFVDITNDDSTPNQFNSSLYITVGIPIGKGKAEKKAAEKQKTNE